MNLEFMADVCSSFQWYVNLEQKEYYNIIIL